MGMSLDREVTGLDTSISAVNYSCTAGNFQRPDHLSHGAFTSCLFLEHNWFQNSLRLQSYSSDTTDRCLSQMYVERLRAPQG